MCVPMTGCMFSALEMPSGASGAGGDEKCSSDAVEPVPEDGTCVVRKADHQCNAAICTSGGEWSNVVCVPSSNPGCQVSEIVAPDGAEVSTEECMSSTEVSSGTTCGFAKAGHVCSSASCVGGSWSLGSCVELPVPPDVTGCSVGDLTLPSGASTSGHANCNPGAEDEVPNDAACAVSKAGHVCSVASCVAGVWSTPRCESSEDPGCVLNDLRVPDGGVVSTEQCLSGLEVPSGAVCGFSKPGHTCTGSSCVAGTWSIGMCVPMPEEGCSFSGVQLPSGASASGHANCRSDAEGVVPFWFSCLLSKPAHTCNAVTCLDDGSWSTALCVPSSNPGCELSELVSPAGSAISVARCLTGGSVATGAVCEFSKAGHTCSGAMCMMGSWSTASCVPSEPGCMFGDLQMPAGASAYGHANCNVAASGAVPSGGAGCMISKPMHTCSAAICTAGRWNTPICMPSGAPACELSELPIPENAEVASDACRTGWNVPHGGVCQFSKPGHVCSGASCEAGMWSPAACVPEPVVTVGCLYSALQVPSGATASGHTHCREDADEPVAPGLSCILSKPGHVCSAATCLDAEGTWSGAECYPSSDPACELSELSAPDGAAISTEACLSGSSVPSGGVCEFSKQDHICSGASCVAGSWSDSSCVEVTEQGCMFEELQLPSGASAYGHEHCEAGANGTVPVGAAACMLSKPGHRCTAAACLPDGSWNKPFCVPAVEPSCLTAALAVPGGASITTEACLSGSEVTSGGVCEFSKPGHVCSAASCVAGTWSPAVCVVVSGCAHPSATYNPPTLFVGH